MTLIVSSNKCPSRQPWHECYSYCFFQNAFVIVWTASARGKINRAACSWAYSSGALHNTTRLTATRAIVSLLFQSDMCARPMQLGSGTIVHRQQEPQLAPRRWARKVAKAARGHANRARSSASAVTTLSGRVKLGALHVSASVVSHKLREHPRLTHKATRLVRLAEPSATCDERSGARYSGWRMSC